MATHSSILAWRIPWTEEPVRLQSMGSQRVRHHWVNNTFLKSPLGNFCLKTAWYPKNSAGLRARRPEPQSKLYHILAVWPQPSHLSLGISFCKIKITERVQWLELRASTAEGMGLSPGQETNNVQAEQYGQKKKKKQKIKIINMKKNNNKYVTAKVIVALTHVSRKCLTPYICQMWFRKVIMDRELYRKILTQNQEYSRSYGMSRHQKFSNISC